MASRNERVSTYTSGSGETEGRNGEQKRNLWASMLESVASGKRLPQKNLLVLGKWAPALSLSKQSHSRNANVGKPKGGTPETQREFIESLSSSEGRRTFDRQKTPPVANNFALGYTYYDVLDADQDGAY